MKEIRYPVAVFAHNEEASIIPCLQSLGGIALDIFVLANGCTDNTVDIVKAYSHAHPNVTLIEIAAGDKSNAWNLFVHEYALKHSDVYFFIDGDVRADQNALNHLSQTLLNNFGAHIAAAVPGSGRNRISQIRMQVKHTECMEISMLPKALLSSASGRLLSGSLSDSCEKTA